MTDTLMNLIDEYAESRHVNGCWVYNIKTAAARRAVVVALSTEQPPQPATLSDDTDRLREALQRIEGASMSMYATRSDMLEHCQDIASAALAAQGGKV